MSFLKRNIAAMIILVAAVAFIAVGAGRGEVETVFRKAVNICMECIGFG